MFDSDVLQYKEPSVAEPQHHWRAAILAATVLILHAFGLWLERWMGSRLLRPGWPRADTLGEIFAPREDSDGLQYRDKAKRQKEDLTIKMNRLQDEVPCRT